MTMPGKGRRSITVNSLRYHYLIAFERSERVSIQSADGNSSFLFVFPFAIMKPSHIAAAIRYGISCGWTPTQKAHDCWLAFDVDANDVAHFEHIPLDDIRQWVKWMGVGLNSRTRVRGTTGPRRQIGCRLQNN